MSVLKELEQGLSHHQAGRLDLARGHYERALQAAPSNTDGLHLLGLLLAQQGELARGIELVSKAVQAVPDNLDYLRSMGNLFVSSGRYDEARKSFETVLAQRPDDLAALVNMGVAYLNDGKPEHAVEMLLEATRLHPENAEAHNILANALDSVGRGEEARRAYTKALEINPDLLPARFNFALYLAKNGRDGEAIEHFRIVETAQPDFPELYYNLGLSLKRQGAYISAEEAYRTAIERAPKDLKSYLNLAGMLQDTARLEESIAIYQQALNIDPGYYKAYSNMLMGLHFIPGLSAQDILQAYRDWGERYADPLANEIQPFSKTPDPDKKLRVGFVSGGFCVHPVAHMAAPVFEHFNRDRFEFIAYETLGREDDITRDIRGHMTQWREVSAMNDVELSHQIREDGIDILFDLGGHGEGGRLLTFARKPAPVQVKWVGAQHGSMGLKVMDYFVTDRFETPKDQERFFDERVVCMPDGYACFRPPAYAPEVGPLPARKNGFITFANFNNLAKLNPVLVEVWARLLERVPDSRILFKTRALRDEAVRERVRNMFAEHGIDTHRLELRPDSPHADLLASYNEVDIAPDPIPFSGCVTTQEALWMGVPVVTLPGDAFSANHSASHVSVVGLNELVAQDVEDYLEKIVLLAEDLDRLEALRETLRDRFAASPLRDETGFTRHFEDALRRMWGDWCAGSGD